MKHIHSSGGCLHRRLNIHTHTHTNSSLWLQNLKKIFFLLSELCVISELEDLSASVDVQDVYTKIKCKVGSFNIDHYRCR